LANIALLYRTDVRGGNRVLCYPKCYEDDLRDRGHLVMTIGEGHTYPTWEALSANTRKGPIDLIIEIENGRNAKGVLHWEATKIEESIPKAAVFIDSHSKLNNHQAVSKAFDHVFFAVWNKRDLFKEHPSAHWCPNVTDLRYFGYDQFVRDVEVTFDVAFFSSKLGLARAEYLVGACEKRGWSYDVREAVKPRRNRWPATGAAMAAARVLFNRGQKQDGPNQRVMESMAARKPLLSDWDPESGMPKLFVDGKHYIAYDKHDPRDLEDKLAYLLENESTALEIARNGYREVAQNHLVSNRVDQILEVCKIQ